MTSHNIVSKQECKAINTPSLVSSPTQVKPRLTHFSEKGYGLMCRLTGLQRCAAVVKIHALPKVLIDQSLIENTACTCSSPVARYMHGML